MHPRFEWDLKNCGVQRALDVLGEKWTLLVLREAFYGLKRFDDFARALACGRGVLSARLKGLVDADVMERREYAKPGARTRAEYHLTAKGRDLYPVILGLSQWSDRWAPPREGPAAIVAEKGGRRGVKVVMTAEPVRALNVDDIVIKPGPGTKRQTARKRA